jgi:hypothetical protein
VALAFGLLALLALLPAGASAERYRRQFAWSGQQWQVRLAKRENPMRNTWWDSRENVRVLKNGSLRMAITRAGRTWRSVEIAGTRRRGYGRYRWVVESDLMPRSLWTVFALFTDDSVHRSPYGEQVFEFSHWGDPLSLPGWAVSWSKRRKARAVKSHVSFPMSAGGGPYQVDVDWRPPQVRYVVRDAAGTAVFDRAWPTASDGQFMVPRMSFWLQEGFPTTMAVPPAMIVRSFKFTPLAKLPAA